MDNQFIHKDTANQILLPDQLDQLVEVISPRSWLPLAFLGSLVMSLLTWSVFGRLPLYVMGHGVLLEPGQIMPFQTLSRGPIEDIYVQSGDRVKKGEVIATIRQEALVHELQQRENELENLQAQTQQVLNSKREEISFNQQDIEQQRLQLRNELSGAKSLAPIIQESGVESIRESRNSINIQLSHNHRLLSQLKNRLAARRSLLTQGAISTDEMFSIEKEYVNSLSQIADLQAQLQHLAVKEAEHQVKAIENQTRIEQLENKLKVLDGQEKELVSQLQDLSFERENKIRQVEHRISQLSQQLEIEGRILSPHNGKILELNVATGQHVGVGARIGTIQADTHEGMLVSLGLFPNEDGKKIAKGMSAQVTPGTVKPERYGGIVGEVVEVSPFPKTTDSIAAQIGNRELAELLGGSQAPVETIIQLTLDSTNASGYEWTSSKGTGQGISSGTSTMVRIKIEEVAPIVYVIPLLRSWTGVY